MVIMAIKGLIFNKRTLPLDLLRLFFTSWSFFDRPGDSFRTRLTLYQDATPILEQNWPETVSFKWWQLIFNPAGNDWHYSKQLESCAAILSQKYPSEDFLQSREFKQYLNHILKYVGPKSFDTISVLLEVKKYSANADFQRLVFLTLPTTNKKTFI